MPKTESFTQRQNKTRDETAQDLHPKFHSEQDLPPTTDNLPARAKQIYREAFNKAQERYADETLKNTNEPTEKIANRVAWKAVKKEFEKIGDDWYERGTGEGPEPKV